MNTALVKTWQGLNVCGVKVKRVQQCTRSPTTATPRTRNPTRRPTTPPPTRNQRGVPPPPTRNPTRPLLQESNKSYYPSSTYEVSHDKSDESYYNCSAYEESDESCRNRSSAHEESHETSYKKPNKSCYTSSTYEVSHEVSHAETSNDVSYKSSRHANEETLRASHEDTNERVLQKRACDLPCLCCWD